MPSYQDLLKSDENFYYWPKYACVKLSDHFTTDEFSCCCQNPSCNEQRINIKLITLLEALRASLGSPIRVTSGFRCKAHQEALRASGRETAKGTSQHELGMAADITCVDLPRLEDVFGGYSLGVGKTFTHVDMRLGSRRWKYAA